MGDLRTSRRPDFHTRKGIRLADGREWTFPAPAESGSSSPEAAFGADYLGLIRAILEAENEEEGRLAELALAMLLIGHEHPLTPSEYRRLFMFEPYSRGLADSQAAFHDLALDHVDYLQAAGYLSGPAGKSIDTPGVFSRCLGRLRNRWPVRAWYQTTRKREMML